MSVTQLTHRHQSPTFVSHSATQFQLQVQVKVDEANVASQASCLLTLNNGLMTGNSPEPQRTSCECSLTLCFMFNSLMTDPHVTKLSSVPSDSPNTQDNNNTRSAGGECGRTAQFKPPIPPETQSSRRCLSVICIVFRYVIEVAPFASVTLRTQRPQRLGVGTARRFYFHFFVALNWVYLASLYCILAFMII